MDKVHKSIPLRDALRLQRDNAKTNGRSAEETDESSQSQSSTTNDEDDMPTDRNRDEEKSNKNVETNESKAEDANDVILVVQQTGTETNGNQPNSTVKEQDTKLPDNAPEDLKKLVDQVMEMSNMKTANNLFNNPKTLETLNE